MSKEIQLRRANANDAKILFEWRNDPEARSQSGTTTPLEWEGHVAWLAESLKNPNRVLVIAEMEGVPIGTMRADPRDDGCTEISYTLAPSMRGRGISKPMVREFADVYLKDRKIVAKIKKGHAPSESIAKMLGLSPHHEILSEDPTDPRPMVEWRKH